jgi:hypothetical protein
MWNGQLTRKENLIYTRKTISYIQQPDGDFPRYIEILTPAVTISLHIFLLLLYVPFLSDLPVVLSSGRIQLFSFSLQKDPHDALLIHQFNAAVLLSDISKTDSKSILIISYQERYFGIFGWFS